MTQLEVHKRIDELVRNQDVETIDPETVRKLINTNQDAYSYFFATVPTVWWDWLLKRGFLDSIHAKPEVSGQRMPFTPELEYLDRVAVDYPSKVTDAMLEVKSSHESFNSTVIGCFLNISSKLPADQLVRVSSKIHDEQWVRLMKGFNRWGFEYESALSTLYEAREFAGFLAIAESLLSVRSKEEISVSEYGNWRESPFYLNDLSHTKVFQYLADIEISHATQALRVVTKTMSDIVRLSTPKKEDVFEFNDVFPLYDADFFTLEVGTKQHLSFRDDVRELAAVLVSLLRKTFDEKCSSHSDVRRIYDQNLKQLPSSATTHRLRLFAVSLCPQALTDEIYSLLFAIFEDGMSSKLALGPEYDHLIQKIFPQLEESNQRDYVIRGLKLFSRVDVPKSIGRGIFSSIFAYLTPSERAEAESKIGKLEPGYIPTSLIGETRSGTVVDQAPSDEELWNGPVLDIATALQERLSPESIKRNYPDNNTFRPINASGVGDLLRTKMLARPSEFLMCAPYFFDREKMHPHYTYSFLRGAHEIFKGYDTNKIDLNPLLKMMEMVRDSGVTTPFIDEVRVDQEYGWLASWTGVHKEITELLQDFLNEEDGHTLTIFKENRDSLLSLTAYLLRHSDPAPKDETLETAKFKSQRFNEDEYLVSDPYTLAINSVRGEAFRAFVSFVYRDGKHLASSGVKIAKDVKGIFEDVLRSENTQALYFMFGHFLPTFYFRDQNWIKDLVPSIFSANPEKNVLYTAAWEGYISNNLFREIFSDPVFRPLYLRAIESSSDERVKRRYFRDPDTGLAAHMALAFVHYEEFDYKSDLFKAFWDKKNETLHGEFISFIGRSFLAGDSKNWEELIQDNPKIIERFMVFWDWVLEFKGEKESCKNFGFWMKIEKPIFELKWLASRIRKTLEKTDGEIEWEYGLQTTITKLAQAAPEDTLAILRLHIFQWGIGAEKNQNFSFAREDWNEAFRLLYSNLATRNGVIALVNDLILSGGRPFWKLKELVKQQ